MVDRRLTSDEYNGLNQIASKTKMDCWFYILEEENKDVILDLENNKKLSIEEGVSQLMEGIVEPLTEYGLSDDEIAAIEKLFEEINGNETEELEWI